MKFIRNTEYSEFTYHLLYCLNKFILHGVKYIYIIIGEGIQCICLLLQLYVYVKIITNNEVLNFADGF